MRSHADRPPRQRAHKDSALRIAPGTVRDVGEIVKLIRGLARFEKLPVRMNAHRLRQHGFHKRPYFQTLVARRGKPVVGFALYFFTYSTFLGKPTLYIEDLFVVPAQRGSGTGTALMRELARIALRKHCGRVEWAVLDWNSTAIDFYRRIGASLRKEWILTRLSGAALRRFAAG